MKRLIIWLLERIIEVFRPQIICSRALTEHDREFLRMLGADVKRITNSTEKK